MSTDVAVHSSKWVEQQVRDYLALIDDWRDDPILYCKERLGISPTIQQRKIMLAVMEPEARVSVASGHNTGKTAALAMLVLWFIECKEYPKIPCTAPTYSQLRDNLWAELAKCIRTSDDHMQAEKIHPRFWLGNMLRHTNHRLYDKDAENEVFAVARTSSASNPDAFQGFHASNIEIGPDGKRVEHEGKEDNGSLLMIVDEASGVSDKVFEVMEGALASGGARCVLTGNPTRNSGYFAKSHRKNRSSFTSVIRLSSLESELIDDPKAYREGLVKKWGEGSNVVRVRCDGLFPKEEKDTVIPFELCEIALSREIDEDSIGLGRRLGIDCARYGDDRTVLVIREGNNVLDLVIRSKQDTMATCGDAVRLIEKWDVTDVFVDVLNMGAGVVDRLRELKYNVHAVNVSNSPPSLDRTEYLGEKPKTMRDFLWLAGRQWLQSEAVSFVGIEDSQARDDLSAELAQPKYNLDSNGRFIVESKDAMKSRLSKEGVDDEVRSPDLADALLTTFWPHHAMPSEGGRVVIRKRSQFRGY